VRSRKRRKGSDGGQRKRTLVKDKEDELGWWVEEGT
jgi:hypothetical protein